MGEFLYNDGELIPYTLGESISSTRSEFLISDEQKEFVVNIQYADETNEEITLPFVANINDKFYYSLPHKMFVSILPTGNEDFIMSNNTLADTVGIYPSQLHTNGFYMENKIYVLSAFSRSGNQIETNTYSTTSGAIPAINLNTGEIDNSALAFPTGTMDRRRNYNSSAVYATTRFELQEWGAGTSASYDSASGLLAIGNSNFGGSGVKLGESQTTPGYYSSAEWDKHTGVNAPRGGWNELGKFFGRNSPDPDSFFKLRNRIGCVVLYKKNINDQFELFDIIYHGSPITYTGGNNRPLSGCNTPQKKKHMGRGIDNSYFGGSGCFFDTESRILVTNDARKGIRTYSIDDLLASQNKHFTSSQTYTIDPNCSGPFSFADMLNINSDGSEKTLEEEHPLTLQNYTDPQGDVKPAVVWKYNDKADNWSSSCLKTYNISAPGYIETIFGVHKDYVFCKVHRNETWQTATGCTEHLNVNYWYTILKRVPDSSNNQDTTNYKYIQTITDEHWKDDNISFYGEWMVTHSNNNVPQFGTNYCPCEDDSYTTYYYYGDGGDSGELSDLELSGWAIDENNSTYWSENCTWTETYKKYKTGNLNFYKLNSATEKWDLQQTIEVDFLNGSSSKPVMLGDTVVLGCPVSLEETGQKYNNATRGRVYVFKKSGNSWSLSKTLYESDYGIPLTSANFENDVVTYTTTNTKRISANKGFGKKVYLPSESTVVVEASLDKTTTGTTTGSSVAEIRPGVTYKISI